MDPESSLVIPSSIIFVGIAVLILYLNVALKPDLVAKGFLSFFNNFLPTNKFPATSFWNILYQLKLRRKVMIYLLTITFGFIVFFDIYLLVQIIIGVELENDFAQNLIVLFGFFVYSIFSAKEFFNIGEVGIPERNHERLSDIQNYVENRL